MPTRAELPLHDITYSEANSWTDALPVCRESAVGSSINQIYREDGNRQAKVRNNQVNAKLSLPQLYEKLLIYIMDKSTINFCHSENSQS
ncbi:hypothetical protein RUM44_002086 [Polyplax serrata]|uniref:Uncharacterized protein n=1 Tax=Polyplax serrata TaxID=468196 RepID=A0ABR1AM84_POLSC